MKIISVGNVFGEAVGRVHNGESVSALFEFQKDLLLIDDKFIR